MASGGKRIFLGTIEVAGFYTQVAAGLRELGVDSVFVDLAPNPFKYGDDRDSLPLAIRMVRNLGRWQQRLYLNESPARLLAYVAYAIAVFLQCLVVLPWAIARFDVFCFGFLSSIVDRRLGYWDIALLRLFGKRVICVFHGADSRPPYMTGPYVRMLRARNRDWAKKLCEMTRQRRRTMRRLERYADVMIDGPWRGHFHDRKFVISTRLGHPAPPPAPPSQESGASGSAVRILHAPSDRQAKGSDVISACITRLKERGHAIEYVEIHGRPQEEVLKQMARCDFVIDQLYADGPMAGLATEAASFGKPAIVCGYARDEFADIPTLYCHPDQLESAVTRLMADGDYRRQLGRRALDYVREFRARRAVAQRLMRIIDGDIPDDWWFDPGNTAYLYGGGMSEVEFREALRGLVAACGPSGLQLDDKPRLRDELLTLAGPRAASKFHH